MNNLLKKFALPVALAASAVLSPVVQAANSVIDVLVVYTKGTNDLYSGDPSTRFNQIAQFTNQVYKDSDVNLEIRVVKSVMVDYTDDNNAEVALNDITQARVPAFAQIESIRQAAKADMVILYRPYKEIHGSCGIAWIGGMGTNGDFSNPQTKSYMYAHVAVNTCGDYVTAHELGHNMGLKHSRKQDTTGGTFPYALGYGIVGNFTTIMAYQSEFNVDYWTGKVYKFSNPALTCKGVPCGVDRTDATNGADAHYAINITGPQIAAFYAGSAANSSAASSKATSSSNSSDIAAATNAVTAAKAAVDAAQAAVNDNKATIAVKVKEEAAATSALKSATTAANSAKSAYEKAVNKYNSTTAKAASLKTTADAALAAYNAAPEKTKAAKLKAYNTAVANYNTAVAQAASDLTAVNLAQTKVSDTVANLALATSASNVAKAATLVEKAKTEALTKALADAKAAYKAATDALALLKKKK